MNIKTSNITNEQISNRTNEQKVNQSMAIPLNLNARLLSLPERTVFKNTSQQF